MNTAINIKNLVKIYKNDFQALFEINLKVKTGEIFALLGPNGAGKTSLINAVCGIINKTSGSIDVLGYDNIKEYKKARTLIGLVPQELTTDSFETVINTVRFTRGLFGKKQSPSHIKKVLISLSLWEKKNLQIRTLSGGMKRRVMIAKALSHEPKILFLDEPSAGVDVELRKSMWRNVRKLRDNGVTIILTTHYIEEAEEMADRIGIINNGKLILVEQKKKIIDKLGEKKFTIKLNKELIFIPDALKKYTLKRKRDKTYVTFKTNKKTNINQLLNDLKENDIFYQDIDVKKSSLEDIFVKLVGKK